MAGTFVSSLYTYPWDLQDETLETSISRIREWTGVREVMLTPSYHVSTYFLPHNPKRPIYWGEDGAIYFQPDPRLYQRGLLQPRVSSVVRDRQNYFERIVAGIRGAELEVGAWLVYLYNHHLAAAYPEQARHDVFGNPCLGQLSAAPYGVRRYVLDLTQYVLERFKPVAVHVESLSRMPWDYGFRNPKVLSPIAPRHQFLLGVDFNGSAKDSWDRRESERLQLDIAEWLRPRLARLPTEEDNQPVTQQWIDQAFEGRLRLYLRTCQQFTTGLWTQVARLIHEKGAKVQSGLVTEASMWRTDLTLECNSFLDRVTVAPNLDSFQVDRIKQQLAQNAIVMVSTQPGSMTTPGLLVQQVQSAKGAGCGGATFYNYGLLREEQLKYIGTALKSL